MTLPIVVLRPEPGASATAEAAIAMALTIEKIPLFSITALPWPMPPPTAYDRLLLTSANAVRHAGPQLQALLKTPCWVVGGATARVADAVGLFVERSGSGGIADLLNGATGPCRLLWLAGEHHSPVPNVPGITITIAPVYRSSATTIGPSDIGNAAIFLVHSKRAAARLSALVSNRASSHIIAISADVARSAGPGWSSVCHVPTPDDGAMLTQAAVLADKG